MVRFCFRYEIYGYEIYGRRCEIYGSLRDLWEGLRDLWEFARFMGVTRFMGRTTVRGVNFMKFEEDRVTGLTKFPTC